MFITVRPHPDSVPQHELFKFYKWCEDIPYMFSFLDHKNKDDNTFCWETVDNEAKSRHFHGVFAMKKGYSPAQMHQQIAGRSAARNWFLPKPKYAVNIQRVRQYDLSTVQDYIAKGGRNDLPPHLACPNTD